MNIKDIDSQKVEFDALVRSLIGLEPAVLAAMPAWNGSPCGTALVGFHELMRRALQQSIWLLWVPDDWELRLMSEEAASRHGYPSAQVYNLIQRVSHALVHGPRRRRGLGDLTLYPVDAQNLDLPWKEEQRRYTPVKQLAAAVLALFDVGADTTHYAPGASGRDATNVYEIVHNLLGLAPTDRLQSEMQGDTGVSGVQHSKGQAIATLSLFLMSIIQNYRAIVETELPTIRLCDMSDDVYDSPADSRLANLSSLFVAALSADGGRDIEFYGLKAATNPLIGAA